MLTSVAHAVAAVAAVEGAAAHAAAAEWMGAAAATAAEQAPVHTVAPPVVPGRVLDVDGDMICYWAGGKEDTAVQVSRTTALRKIEFMREMSGSESVVVHLTADSSTKGDRRLIAQVKEYQGQRKSGRKPRNWQYLRDFFTTYTGNLFTVKVWATREADDGICFTAHAKPCAPGEVPNRAIASADKDMRMIPGWHIDWNTAELVGVPLGCFEQYNADRSKLFGHKWFWMQMLQGDTADNIPGLPKLEGKAVGPARAEKVLSGARDNAAACECVALAYQLEYGDEWLDRFVEQGLLLWMRRDAAASIRDLAGFLIGVPWLMSDEADLALAFNRVEARIKEAYAKAQSLGSCGVQEDRA